MSVSNHLIDHLRAASAEREDAVFARLPDGATLSYAALFDRAARMAGALQGLGVTPGDRVAAQIPKSLAAIELYLGTVMAGGVFLPLNSAYTPSEVEYFLTDAEPRVVVCAPEKEPDLARIAARCGLPAVMTLDGTGAGTMTEAAEAAAPADPVARGAEDLAAILYTSGTTGRSKGAMLSHRALASNSLMLVEAWKFTREDVLIHALPIFHTHGLFVATNVTLMSGASCIFLSGFDADAILEALPQATALMGVPTFYTRLLQRPELTQERCANMRLFISGSAPLLAETHRDWEARTGHRILERYGMTETNMNVSNPYEGERRAGTVGFPLPGVELRIMADGVEVPQGGIGVIEVRGENVFSGYWRMPEKTAEELREDGWFITGDLGMIDPDGYVVIVGRAKDLVISGGFNVYPKEVEELLDDQPGVLESAVFGLPHPDFGEAVAAAIVLSGERSGAEEAALRAAVAEKLANFKQPKAYFFLDALPRNTMGKVQKAQLRKDYGETFG